MKTTLNAIRAHRPCSSGWEKLLRHLGKTQADDEPLLISTIVESNGIYDAMWCLRAVKGHYREILLFAVWCVRQVQHLMTDPRSLNALDVAERYANGLATTEEFDAAMEAAMDAAMAAAWEAASFDSSALYAAWYAASAAAWADASAAAWADASAAAWADESADARDAKKAELLRICAEIEAREEA